MAMKLRTDTLYVIGERFSCDDEHSAETFGRTPDGVGMYWYADEEEARGDVEPVKATRMFDTHKEFDETFGR